MKSPYDYMAEHSPNFNGLKEATKSQRRVAILIAISMLLFIVSFILQLSK